MSADVRDERAGDVVAVRTVVTRAFGRADEARLVDVLRDAGKATIALVAERDGVVLGHVLFSPVTLDMSPLDASIAPSGASIAPFGLGLAPLAVAPEAQRQGIGGALVLTGLARCRDLGATTVVVLGDPAYYGRFGFVAADQRGLGCEYDVPPGVFQVIELVPGALSGRRGLVRYAPEFAAV
jgi:putative acetyltransferase